MWSEIRPVAGLLSGIAGAHGWGLILILGFRRDYP